MAGPITASPTQLALPLDGFSRWHDLKKFIPLSRETVRKRELEGRFPRRQYLTKRCAIWANSSLHEYMADPVNYRAPEADTGEQDT